ncbi:MAG: CBS domain-containing protein [Planctomycetes bacterium]|nr:CBS domain-containing protein [Planctomycetota bacterium]MCC7173444.1 CBS domain-containing protein [Planctomycetota bacterium]
MTTIWEVLERKGHEVHTIEPDATVFDALVTMAQKNIGALVVLENGRVAGVLSERDYARKVILRGESSKELTVRKIMSRGVICVAPERTVAECMALMTDMRVRHLPVVAEEKLVGVISIGDVVKAVIAEKEFIIEQLEGYIRGNW